MVRQTRETIQKETIKSHLEKMPSFFTAKDLHNKIKDKKIGIATIYRFLKKLKNRGEIHSYICKKKILYSIKEKNHAHFTCESCKSVQHISIKNLDFIKNQLSENICHIQIDISGTCDKCKKE